MADELIQRAKQGSAVWNDWRHQAGRAGEHRSHPDLGGAILIGADLIGADLARANLSHADLSGANLRGAILNRTDLSQSSLREADLSGADLDGANISHADLSGANLRGAILNRTDLSQSSLREADLTGADLNRANFTGADMFAVTLTKAALNETVFANLDLTNAIGLDNCVHRGPSLIDFRTLEKSQMMPLSFLRGIGVPERLVEYLPAIIAPQIQYYSCFISYSTKDQDFAKRLHTDLQVAGVRCWFAPHDLAIGGKILDEIDTAIRVRDKVLLILSEHSIKSDWIEDEIVAAFGEERVRNHMMLFPLRLDDAVLETEEPWAAKLRTNRIIFDFGRWKDHDAYQRVFSRLIRDLATSASIEFRAESSGR